MFRQPAEKCWEVGNGRVNKGCCHWVQFNQMAYEAALSPEQKETWAWATANIPNTYIQNSDGFHEHMRLQRTTPIDEENKGTKPEILHEMADDASGTL
jgi:hypothetical protein